MTRLKGTLSVVVALMVVLAWSVAAADLTLEQHQKKVEKVAPPYAIFPGKTLCVCQAVDSNSFTFVGYLYSFISASGGYETVNMTCAYPAYAGPNQSISFCSRFEVIR